MTRREFILGITAALGVSALARPIRSALGGQNTDTTQKKGYTAADYIQEGLIALWDGIENVDWNKSDVASTTWNDLVGGRKATLTSHGSFSGYSLVCDGVGYAAKDGTMFSRSNVRAVEIVFDSASTGIIACIAGSAASTSAIRVIDNGGNLLAQNVNSSSLGLKNRIAFSRDGIATLSLTYGDADFLGGYINGQWKNSYYQASAPAATNIAFGGRSENSDVPWFGQIFSIRVYDRQLSESEVLQNLQVDNWRFGT